MCIIFRNTCEGKVCENKVKNVTDVHASKENVIASRVINMILGMSKLDNYGYYFPIATI